MGIENDQIANVTNSISFRGSANNGDRVDPSLSPAGLPDNGEPTQMRALLPGSPRLMRFP
jgi:hypothetical protein